jgi:hypothetical protein
MLLQYPDDLLFTETTLLHPLPSSHVIYERTPATNGRDYWGQVMRVHPEVLTIMQEVGIDLSHAKPQKLTQELANDASLLITMGCGDKCPYVPGLRRDDWPLRSQGFAR